MTENTGTSGGSSAYPGSGGQPQPPSYGQNPPPPVYSGQPPPPYPGQPTYPGQPPYPGQHPPAYGSPDPNAYLGPPSYPTGGYGMPPPSDQQRGWSGLAIAAFVASLVPLVGILAAVPLAIIALVKIAKSGDKGKGLAIAAIIISVLWWAGAIILGVWFAGQQVERNDAGEITEEGIVEFGEIRVGDCVNIPDPAGTEDVKPFDLKGVPCGEVHNAQAVSITPIDAESYPGESSLDNQSLKPCLAALTSELDVTVGPGDYLPYRLYPTESVWDDDNSHRVVCFVTKDGFGDMTGSLM